MRGEHYTPSSKYCSELILLYAEKQDKNVIYNVMYTFHHPRTITIHLKRYHRREGGGSEIERESRGNLRERYS